MRRPRNLSAEERALWDSVAKQAKPLRKSKRNSTLAAVRLPLPTGERSDRSCDPGEGALHLATKSPLTPTLSPVGRGSASSRVAGATPNVGIERRERSRLARGARDIDARIDLHGMTQARAHRALLSFLQRAQADGSRYVLVITGKGKASAEGYERGVLKRQVPEWFTLAEFRVLVTGYEEAAISHGGAGALYVRVRRG